MDFIETHCHLDDDAFESDLPVVLENSRAAGVRHFINIGYEPESWTRSIELAERYPDVSYALGMHPNSADEWSDSTAAQLEALLQTESPVAIGEIGLDFYREHADHDAQRRAFRDQLELAQRFDLPVVIHMRGDVEQEVMDLLRERPQVGVIFHSFDGSARLRDFALERGGTIGVGGLMTRARSTTLREVLRSTPLSSMLLETDSPYLIPKGVKSRRNTPASIPIIAAALGELLGVSVQDVAIQTTENAMRVFGIGASIPGGAR